MIVMYAVAAYKWHLAGRWLVKTPYMSLVNILANRELVPEFMPFYGSPLPIARAAVELLTRPELRDSMTRGLLALTRPLHPSADQTAAEKVAEQVELLMNASPPPQQIE
jgi:lipid-A-disaccharide synthase